ncbi:hypothetical protein CPLU01_00634 [Colletotrichum plurivorum]|uniref:Uncharacterized protein n=1 Tax=Colletotrichum plurivorum TaxID=2175906 RepID=A0A8H6NS78_9PEZI|nr:hypothetical protein CPLU01_00634 [Colletotrichum plurivorum]
MMAMTTISTSHRHARRDKRRQYDVRQVRGEAGGRETAQSIVAAQADKMREGEDEAEKRTRDAETGRKQ